MVGIYRSYGAKFILRLWFYKDAAPDGAGGDSGGTGAAAFLMPEPDTRKTRLTRAAKQARTPINSNRKESLRRRQNWQRRGVF
jgi:hypothetical protein